MPGDVLLSHGDTCTWVLRAIDNRAAMPPQGSPHKKTPQLAKATGLNINAWRCPTLTWGHLHVGITCYR